MGSRRLAGFAPRVLHPLSTQSSRTILQPCPTLAWPLPCLLQGTSSECVGHTAQSSAAEAGLPVTHLHFLSSTPTPSPRFPFSCCLFCRVMLFRVTDSGSSSGLALQSSALRVQVSVLRLPAAWPSEMHLIGQCLGRRLQSGILRLTQARVSKDNNACSLSGLWDCHTYFYVTKYKVPDKNARVGQTTNPCLLDLVPRANLSCHFLIN